MKVSNTNILGFRGGFPVYGRNPSIAMSLEPKKYIRLNCNMMKMIANLTKSGMKVFEFVINVVNNQDVDVGYLILKPENFSSATGNAGVTFRRGVRELVSNGFLVQGEVNSMFFLGKRLSIELEVPPAEPKKGFVYLLYDAESSLTKIGRTTRSDGSRQKQIIGAHPTPLENVLTIDVDDCIEAESRCHKHFSRHRKNGEWFSADLSSIVQYLSNNFSKSATWA